MRGPLLVVDDDVDIREILAEVLFERGFQVYTAANGREALNLLRTLAPPPTVVLLDLMMPIMGGYEFLDLLSRETDLAPIPVVVISADHGVDRKRIRAHDRIVRKPIDMSQLVAVLDELAPGNVPRHDG